MNATELFHADGKSAGVFYCTECKRVSNDKQSAENCCQSYHCESCGVECEQYHRLCGSCSRDHYYKKWLDSISKAEESPGYEGPVWDDARYYQSMDDYLDHVASHEDIEPEPWLNCATFIPVRLDLRDVLERQFEDFTCEDGYNPLDDVEGLDELQAAVDRFNELNKDVGGYEADMRHKVRVEEV